MKITRILSNNAVMLLSNKNEEFVAVGRGVGFGRKTGDQVEQDLIENLFGKKNQGLEAYFASILGEIPPSTLQLVEKIILMAEQSLNISTPQTLFLTLSDHINAAILRHENGTSLRNGLLWEIRSFYPNEYTVAQRALVMLREELDIDLPDDESGFIALHFANAVSGGSLQNHIQSTEILHDILNIVRYEMHNRFDESNETTQRFIIHLRFFIQRLLNNNQYNVGTLDIYSDLPCRIPDAHESAVRIRDFIKKNYSYSLNSDEFAFLTLHLYRLKNNI